MQRRKFIKWSSLLTVGSSLPLQSMLASNKLGVDSQKLVGNNDRMYWVNLLEKIANPILSAMSNERLRTEMIVEYSPTWDGRNKEVAYFEAFGRLLAGSAPFLALTESSPKEEIIRKKMLSLTIRCLVHAVNPESPDYLSWSKLGTAQTLVDAAYLAQAFLTAPQVLWDSLNTITKNRYIDEFKKLRSIKPFNSNWLLFSAMIESFLLFIGEEIVASRIDNAIEKINQWYVGDGWYSDGDQFHFDHYNGYVVHTMLVEVLRVNIQKGRRKSEEYNLAYKRMQRYAFFQERFISPEGTFLVVGRSATYRMGVFQPLAKLALDNALPDGITPAQVRSALTAVMKNVFIPSTFTKGNWLSLGLVGNQQKDLADYYSNTGSMYITSLVFLPLGLKASHPFWSDPFTDWTQRKAWSGQPFPKDYAVNY